MLNQNLRTFNICIEKASFLGYFLICCSFFVFQVLKRFDLIHTNISVELQDFVCVCVCVCWLCWHDQINQRSCAFTSFESTILLLPSQLGWACLIVQMVKKLPAMQEVPVQFQEDPLEKGQDSQSTLSCFLSFFSRHSIFVALTVV